MLIADSALYLAVWVGGFARR
uniref:Uncharacterized protein n=1 Tax=Zea mays TaxID=4577 RepID=C4J8A2_MAIZE|nr:unknown [Zea mays]